MKLEQALLYEELGDYENAIKILYESREIAESKNLQDKQVSIHWKIANLYTTTFAFNKAKKHLHLERTIAEKLNKKELLSKANQGLYRLHSMIESDSAKYYLDKVAYYSKDSKDLAEQFKVNNNFFKYHFGRKEYSLAKFFSKRSLEIAEANKNKQ